MTLYIRIVNWLFGWEYVHLHGEGTRRVRYNAYGDAFVYRFFCNGDYIVVLTAGDSVYEPITKCRFIDEPMAIDERRKFLGAAD